MNFDKVVHHACDTVNYKKMSCLQDSVFQFIGKFIEILQPDSVFVQTDSQKDLYYIKKRAVVTGEEIPLSMDRHTVHFDGLHDQARDKSHTRFLISHNELDQSYNYISKEKGKKEVISLLEDSMKGKEMYVLFYGLGPLESAFSLYGVQITDSAYVAHSENILYRNAYSVFKKKSVPFLRFVHSAGELTQELSSKNIEKRRIYIDVNENISYSVNTQYAGNTVGLKKLALRMAIKKSNEEGWLAEHMFVMGVDNPDETRTTYFSGAFPSACGKTSTCMVEGEHIVGDDIAYLREKNGSVYGVNAEAGILGILKDINKENDPLTWDVLHSLEEIIFSNVLVHRGIPYWKGDTKNLPQRGINFSGVWYTGKTDEEQNAVPFAHSNARYAIRLPVLDNYDPRCEDPGGVNIQGIIYGGRDSRIWPPLFESFDWVHGVVTMAASLESETTSATLGKRGVLQFNPMAILDFLSISLGEYITGYLHFGAGLKNPPVIFGVNYFRKEQGTYITGMEDKRVWLTWMEQKVHNDVKALKTPIGYFPVYKDLKVLFKKVLNKKYLEKDYVKQFTLPVKENMEKIKRIRDIYQNKEKIPEIVFETLEEQYNRLKKAQKEYGDYISPKSWVHH